MSEVHDALLINMARASRAAREMTQAFEQVGQALRKCVHSLTVEEPDPYVAALGGSPRDVIRAIWLGFGYEFRKASGRLRRVPRFRRTFRL